MGSLIEDHAAHVLPPRAGQTLVIATDSTARSYDISGLLMGDIAPGEKRRHEVFVCVVAETQDAYINFSTVAKTVSDTAASAAGTSPPAYADGHSLRVPSGGIMPFRFRLDRQLDKFLNVKTAATGGLLRIWVSSPEAA